MTNRFRNLRVRFALWTAGLLLIALLLFGLYVYLNMSRSLIATVDETLNAVAIQLIAEDGRRALVPLDDISEEPQYERLREQGLSLRVLSLSGETIQRYGPYQMFPQPAAAYYRTPHAGFGSTIPVDGALERLRIYTTQMHRDDELLGVLQVGQNLTSVDGTLNLLLITLLIGVPVIAVAAGIGGYFLAARALAPIDAMTQVAHDLSAQDLSARLTVPTTRDEVGRLAVTLNSMLARLERAFQRERQFTADASHELRTPLAAMQMIIDSTVTQSRTADEYREALADLRHESEQMRSLTEGLLHLARSEDAGQLPRREAIEVAVLLKDVVDSLQPMADEKGLCLRDEVVDEATIILGDSDALIRLFVNLVDNAIKYTERGTITVGGRLAPDGQYVITVADTGPGIAAEHLPHLFARFYRVDKARSRRGIGLGLAIAQSIARGHGGEIKVESTVGWGTTFTVQFDAKPE